LRVNDRIRAREVRVIDPGGVQLGIMPVPDALGRARELGLDLIEVAPQATPPVCKIMDYGKFRYEERKSQRDAAKRSRQVELKNVRVRPGTDEHDISFKIRNAQRFLAKGMKVKCTVIFRGPEMRHPEIGREKLLRVARECDPYGEVEASPRQEGRQMHMVLTPRPNAPPPPAKLLKKERPPGAPAGAEEHEEEDHDEDEDEDQARSRQAVQGERHGQAPAPADGT